MTMTVSDDNDIELGLIVLGASSFSSPDLYGNPSFKRSKNAFVAEATANGVGSVLDLFDSELAVSGLMDKVEHFLRLHRSITDLVIYYCGHGGFTKASDFYLALRPMRKGRESSEGLGLRQLRSDLDDWLSGRRVYLVLDCCFAGAAFAQSQWMSGGDTATVIANQVFESFPRTGTALLAAAPASAAAKAFEGEEYTVFTSALARVLHDGIDGVGERLSLRDLFKRAEDIIKSERAGTAPIPELYPRAHDHSDIAGTPIFLNAAQTRLLSGEKTANEGRQTPGLYGATGTRQQSASFEEATPSLAGRIDQIARGRGPLDLALQAIVSAFLLSLLSTFCGLGWLEHNGKQVGFLFAPNWTIVYLVLFPPYLSFFSVLTKRCRATLIDFSNERILIDSNGLPVPQAAILAEWNKSLKDVSVIMWVFLAAVAIQTVGEWVVSCFRPLITNQIGDVAIDWSTAAIVDPQLANPWSTMLFTAVAYAYMGVALFIYVAILIYAAAFAVFLNNLSDNSGKFRLVFRNQILWQRLSEIVTIVYACVILGIGAAIAMRAQAEYLKSDYELITEFWFSDLVSVFNWLRGGAMAIGPSQPFHIPSEWTSFMELFFTIFMLFIVVYLVYCAFDKARGYYLEHINLSDWRLRTNIEFNPAEIEEVRSRTFLESVVPRHLDMGVILAGEVCSYFFIGFGSIGMATLLYAILKLVIAPAMRGVPKVRYP